MISIYREVRAAAAARRGVDTCEKGLENQLVELEVEILRGSFSRGHFFHFFPAHNKGILIN
jgi:hypothetical protein